MAPSSLGAVGPVVPPSTSGLLGRGTGRPLPAPSSPATCPVGRSGSAQSAERGALELAQVRNGPGAEGGWSLCRAFPGGKAAASDLVRERAGDWEPTPGSPGKEGRAPRLRAAGTRAWEPVPRGKWTGSLGGSPSFGGPAEGPRADTSFGARGGAGEASRGRATTPDSNSGLLPGVCRPRNRQTSPPASFPVPGSSRSRPRSAQSHPLNSQAPPPGRGGSQGHAPTPPGPAPETPAPPTAGARRGHGDAELPG